MDTEKHAGGRPPIEKEQRKKSRGISLTDAEHNKLAALAEAAGYKGQISKYLIKKLKLS